MNATQKMSSGPWWKFGHMWIVVGGPALVVLASFVTIYLAISRPDPVYADAPADSGPRVEQPGDASGAGTALTPAMQARNHAASPESAKLLQGAAPQRLPGHP